MVDDREYIAGNCFQHQLHQALSRVGKVEQVTALEMQFGHPPEGIDAIVCCLKQRTVHRLLDVLKRYLDGRPWVFYDQDPWNAYMDDSPYKGVYDNIVRQTNITSIAVTTEWWVEYMESHGVPASFVKMWMLPEYCDAGPRFEDRPIRLGFIGGVHPHRKRLFEALKSKGCHVEVIPGGLSYPQYLTRLHDVACYIHTEDRPIMLDGVEHNLNVGLWAREIEVASRGCFSIRDRGQGKESYLENIPTARVYDWLDNVADILQYTENMFSGARETLVKNTVEHIRDTDEWLVTAERLKELGAC